MKSKFLIVFILAICMLTACTLFSKKEVIEPPKEIKQWAITAAASDAYGGIYGGNRDDQSPYAATGAPDVEKCEDSGMAWTASKEDNGEQWLELGYEKEVYVSRISIKESFGPGSVIRVEILDNEAGSYRTLWEGRSKSKLCPGFFTVGYELKEGNITKTMAPFLSDKIKITFDTDIHGWNEVDAVELAGYDQKWYMYNQTLFIESTE